MIMASTPLRDNKFYEMYLKRKGFRKEDFEKELMQPADVFVTEYPTVEKIEPNFTKFHAMVENEYN